MDALISCGKLAEGALLSHHQPHVWID